MSFSATAVDGGRYFILNQDVVDSNILSLGPVMIEVESGGELLRLKNSKLPEIVQQNRTSYRINGLQSLYRQFELVGQGGKYWAFDVTGSKQQTIRFSKLARRTKFNAELWEVVASVEPRPTGTEQIKPAASVVGPQRKANVHLASILEGVPGTGKTFAIGARVRKLRDQEQSSNAVTGDGQGQWAITLHPATSYEDFVEGLRPTVNGNTTAATQPEMPKITGYTSHDSQVWFWQPMAAKNESGFSTRDGFFVRVCAAAARQGDKWFVVLLDEINRCNIPKVLGDLLTTLEPAKRARWTGGAWNLEDAQVVTLPYSQRLFFVPDNVVVIATMNTTDRSVTGLDSALRRRFAFERVWPLSYDNSRGNGDTNLVLRAIMAAVPVSGAQEAVLADSVKFWVSINDALNEAIGPDGLLGHSYLFDLAKALTKDRKFADDVRWFREKSPLETAIAHWNRHLLPQLVDLLESANLFDAVEKGPNPEGIAKVLLGGVHLSGPGTRATLQIGLHGANHLQRRMRIYFQDPLAVAAKRSDEDPLDSTIQSSPTLPPQAG